MRDDRERLHDMLEAIDRIQRYAARGRQAFEDDELIQTWVIHHIEILGEAARGVSEALRTRSPNVPWKEIVALRNVLSHEYFGVDVARVWSTIDRDLSPLKEQISVALETIDPDTRS